MIKMRGCLSSSKAYSYVISPGERWRVGIPLTVAIQPGALAPGKYDLTAAIYYTGAAIQPPSKVNKTNIQIDAQHFMLTENSLRDNEKLQEITIRKFSEIANLDSKMDNTLAGIQKLDFAGKVTAKRPSDQSTFVMDITFSIDEGQFGSTNEINTVVKVVDIVN